MDEETVVHFSEAGLAAVTCGGRVPLDDVFGEVYFARTIEGAKEFWVVRGSEVYDLVKEGGSLDMGVYKVCQRGFGDGGDDNVRLLRRWAI